MSKLIKNGEFQADTWTILPKNTTPEGIDNQCVHIGSWNEAMLANPKLGLWLDSDDSLGPLPSKLTGVAMIAINFPALSDGRGFSLARQIREQAEFSGELRAIGNFMQDQVFYLKRCGFDSFVVADDADMESYKISFNSFSDTYQAAVDEPRPLFRRRS